MLTIAGGILIAVAVMIALPIIFGLIGSVLRGTGQVASLGVVLTLAVVPIVVLISIGDSIAPNFGPGLAIGTLIFAFVAFTAWDKNR